MVTCNGLVILGDDHCTNLSIWNPSTAFFGKIPDPGIWAEVATGHGYGRYDIYALWGFGYVSATDDFRTEIELGCIDGCLRFYPMNTGRDIEVWVMREYRVRKSWIKLFKFSLDDIPNVFTMSQFFVLESGSAFINSDLKEFIRIECHKEDKPVLSGRYRMEKWEPMNLGLWDKLESLRKDGQDANFLKVMFYDETLVSVPE